MTLVKDSRGRPSWTLTLAIPAAVLITLRYLLGGVAVDALGATLTVVSGAEYALAVGVWLAFFGYREHDEKRNGRRSPTEGDPR